MNAQPTNRMHVTQAREGMALLLALGILVAITAFSTALLTGLRISYNQAQVRERQTQCTNIAEAGIEKALAELRTGSGYYSGEKDTSFGPGSFTVVVTPSADGRVALTSTGVLSEGTPVEVRVSVDAAVVPGGQVRVLRWDEELHR